MEAINRGNAVVFFDVVLGGGQEDKSGGSPLGRIKLELFVKDVSVAFGMNRVTLDTRSAWWILCGDSS